MDKLLYEPLKYNQLKTQSLPMRAFNDCIGAYIVTNNYNTKAASRGEINSDLGNWTLNGKHRVKLGGLSTRRTGLKGTPK